MDGEFMRDILAWGLTTEVVGLAVLPILRAFFSSRCDAALLSRPLGLALVAYLGWAGALVFPDLGFSIVTLRLALILVALVAWLGIRRKSADPSVRAPVWGSEEKLAAAIFWGATAIFLAIRAVGPAVLGAEKFMDLAFLGSLRRYPGMPPADPWMSGLTINYYYWGYLLAAAQARIGAVPAMTAYNLAVATFAGFSFAAAACLGLRLSRGRLAVALAGAVGTVFASNLVGALDAWNAPFAADFDYWHASRVIGPEDFKTINEFPFFTFFHADLHPHLLAFPFFIAAFAVAHRWMEMKGGFGLRRWLWLLLPAFVAGTARAASLWNMPALGILLVVCGALAPEGGARVSSVIRALGGALVGFAGFAASLFLFYAYTTSFQLENKGLGRATMFSGALEFLGVWGIFFAVIGAALWPGRGEDTEDVRRRRGLRLIVAAAACLLAGLLLGRPAMPILLFLSLLAARALWRSLRAPEADADGVFAAFLLLLGFAMVAGCEFVFFKDNYGRDLQRMNTIFKFYHQAWPLIAVGAAVFAARALDAAAGTRRRALRFFFGAAAAVSLLWAVNVTISRLRQKDGPLSLDAAGPLARRNIGDAAAIEWLLKNTSRGDVVMEASGDPYTEFARISSHSGIPTVMGWANHEGLWREKTPSGAEVMERLGRVKDFYTNADPRRAWETLQKYRVTHVVVGDMERRAYPGADRVALIPNLRLVHDGPTRVYKVERPL
jgi:YYY domain-containing protein